MKNRKVALVLLPLFWPNMPPLGLACLKGHLTRNNVTTKCFDLNNMFYCKARQSLREEWRKSCNVALEEDIWDIMNNDRSRDLKNIVSEIIKYDIIGLSVYKSNITTVKKFIYLLKEKKQEIKIVLGGPEIARKYFDLGGKITEEFGGSADLLVVGEGEKALLSFVKEGSSDKIALYKEMSDLSQSAIPEHSDLDLKKYPRDNTVSLLYSRGCIRSCAFCAERLLYKKFRVYPVENILKQIRAAKDRGVKQFVFHDSLINGDLAALDTMCDQIISEFGSISWEAQAAIKVEMPETLFRKIKQSGCYHLFIGLESGCDTVLQKMNKGFTTEDAVSFFKQLKKHDISFGVSIITGFPGETEEEFTETLDFIVRNKSIIPKIEQVNPFVYYDGIDLPPEDDYRTRKGSMERARRFIDKISGEGFKYTKAFMLNLVEPEWK